MGGGVHGGNLGKQEMGPLVAERFVKVQLVIWKLATTSKEDLRIWIRLTTDKASSYAHSGNSACRSWKKLGVGYCIIESVLAGCFSRDDTGSGIKTRRHPSGFSKHRMYNYLLEPLNTILLKYPIRRFKIVNCNLGDPTN